jgi:hypothetical protein
MAIVYVEARPKGKQPGSPVIDHVVEDHADHILKICSTQTELSSGRKRTATIPMSRGSGISTIKNAGSLARGSELKALFNNLDRPFAATAWHPELAALPWADPAVAAGYPATTWLCRRQRCSPAGERA